MIAPCRAGSVVGIDVAGMSRDEGRRGALREDRRGHRRRQTPRHRRQVALTDLGTTIDIDATVARVFAANQDWPAYAEALVKARPVGS